MTHLGNPKINLILFVMALGACNHKNNVADKDKLDLSQNVSNTGRFQDTAFRQFEKTWTKFINRSPELVKEVMPINVQDVKTRWEPVITSDCEYLPEAQVNVPVVEITWNEVASQTPQRLDIALQYQGFEKNYYTTVFPIENSKRFNIHLQSQFLRDTAAVLLAGPPLFPKIQRFAALNLPATANTGQVIEGQNPAVMIKSTLRLTDLGPGLSYRIRRCTLVDDRWMPTQEVIFNIPVCPMDYKD